MRRAVPLSNTKRAEAPVDRAQLANTTSSHGPPPPPTTAHLPAGETVSEQVGCCLEQFGAYEHRSSHNPKVVGSNPTPATNESPAQRPFLARTGRASCYVDVPRIYQADIGNKAASQCWRSVHRSGLRTRHCFGAACDGSLDRESLPTVHKIASRRRSTEASGGTTGGVTALSLIRSVSFETTSRQGRHQGSPAPSTCSTTLSRIGIRFGRLQASRFHAVTLPTRRIERRNR
jgi:hypothetical protein